MLCKYEHGEVEKVAGWSGMDVSEQNSWMSDPPKNTDPDALGVQTGSVSPKVLEELRGAQRVPPEIMTWSKRQQGWSPGISINRIVTV